jgi:hypothetical protein
MNRVKEKQGKGKRREKVEEKKELFFNETWITIQSIITIIKIKAQDLSWFLKYCQAIN